MFGVACGKRYQNLAAFESSEFVGFESAKQCVYVEVDGHKPVLRSIERSREWGRMIVTFAKVHERHTQVIWALYASVQNALLVSERFILLDGYKADKEKRQETYQSRPLFPLPPSLGWRRGFVRRG
jgi:hypothetical protein